MKSMAKRTLVTLLALMLLASAILPAALAAESRLAANGSMTTYVGLKTQLTIKDKYGYKRDPGDYYWRSSRSSVASVNSSGIVTAKSRGSTTITATNRYDSGDVAKMVVTVARNRVAINISKPSASAVPYKSWDVMLKGLEIVSPTRVDVEYYLVCNYPSNWRATRLKSMKDNIRAISRTSGEVVATIVNGYGSTVRGFTQRWGKSVQSITITYKGSAVDTTNIRLGSYDYRYYPEGVLTRSVR